jgi:hypothetical protein
MLLEIVCGFLFLISSGLLFNEKFRENKPLVLATAAIAVASTYFLTVELIGSIVASKMREAQAAAANSTAENVTMADTGLPDPVQNSLGPVVPVPKPTFSAPAPTSAPTPTPTPVAPARAAGELAPQWLSAKLYGSDNGVAALMSVRIGGSAGSYTATIENQMGFVCRLGVSASGDPGYVEACRSKDGTRSDRNRIPLHCASNRSERVCTGEYVMISDLNVPGKPGLTSEFPGMITIARRL